MINYHTGYLGLRFIWRLEGSVFPKALWWAVPATLATFLLNYADVLDQSDMQNVERMWAGYTFVLGFLIVFRNSHAYTRFWESATLMQQMQAEWMNAISSLYAFCSTEEAKQVDVKEFQYLLARLMSMLHCQALQLVCELKDDSFEIMDLTGFDEESLGYLARVENRRDVLLHWIHRAIVDAQHDGILTIAAPILSRAFQELSRGNVIMNNIRKVKDVPFPFPYEQMIQTMLIVHSLFTPLLSAGFLAEAWSACALTFFIVASYWGLLYIAREIDHPFGDDKNDFNVADMQHAMNQGLLTLLHPLAQKAPCGPTRLSLRSATTLALVSSNNHLSKAKREEVDHADWSNRTKQALQELQEGSRDSLMRDRSSTGLVPIPMTWEPSHGSMDVSWTGLPQAPVLVGARDDRRSRHRFDEDSRSSDQMDGQLTSRASTRSMDCWVRAAQVAFTAEPGRLSGNPCNMDTERSAYSVRSSAVSEDPKDQGFVSPFRPKRPARTSLTSAQTQRERPELLADRCSERRGGAGVDPDILGQNEMTRGTEYSSV